MMSEVVRCWSPLKGQHCCCPSCPADQILWPGMEGDMAGPAATGRNPHWEAYRVPVDQKTQDWKRGGNKAGVGWELPEVTGSVSLLGRSCVHIRLSLVRILRSNPAYLSQPSLLPEGRRLCPLSELCPENKGPRKLGLPTRQPPGHSWQPSGAGRQSAVTR